MSRFIPEAIEEVEIEAILPPKIPKEEKPVIFKNIKPILKQDVQSKVHKGPVPIPKTRIQPIISFQVQNFRKNIQPVAHKETKPIIHKRNSTSA